MNNLIKSERDFFEFFNFQEKKRPMECGKNVEVKLSIINDKTFLIKIPYENAVQLISIFPGFSNVMKIRDSRELKALWYENAKRILRSGALRM
jgi:hypothetical protein